MREESRRWLEQAREDFETAKANFQIKKYYACAFFCQQAAEKSLKAVSVEKLKNQPKTRSLIELKDLVKADPVADELRELNPDYTVSRYPDAANGVPAKTYDAKKAERKLEAAEKILRWVDQCIH